MLEVVSAFDWIEQIADFSDSFPEVLDCPGGAFSQMRFEFGKGHVILSRPKGQSG